jgi:hypothetical protein
MISGISRADTNDHDDDDDDDDAMEGSDSWVMVVSERAGSSIASVALVALGSFIEKRRRRRFVSFS